MAGKVTDDEETNPQATSHDGSEAQAVVAPPFRA
jgi:hypothetical protein